jgi:DNA-binding CsgD family transcriptional regulator/tetratricopeptide (TPR) repeat protein
MALLERDAPLRLAAEAVEQARLGRGGTLLVCGEAGIGKSTLIGQVLADLPPGPLVLQGRCEDLPSPRPLGPLHDMAGAQRLPPPLRRAMDNAASADALFSSFLDVVGSTIGGTVVVIEDLHWADQATLDLVKYLSRRIGALPVLLVLTFRDDGLGPDHPLRQALNDLPPWSVRRLALRPLSAAAVAAMASGAGRPDTGLHDATGGNPFFVTEVLASGVVDALHGVPSTVRDAVHRRLSRLSSAQRGVLNVLCVIPGWAELWLAQALLPHERDAVEACVERGVLTAHGGALAFRHELARRAVLDALAPARRQAAHTRVLAALAAAPEGLAPSLSRLTHHAAEAGDAAQVLGLAPRAAIEAAAVGSHREAALQLAAALRFADDAAPAVRAQLFESWSYEAGLSLAIDEQVIDARHQAIALWRREGRIDKVGLNLRWLARLHWYRGESALAEQYTEEAVATLEPLPPGPELAWAYSVRSQHFMLQDQTDLAVHWGERAIALARQLGQAEILCHALNNVGTAEMFAGRAGGQARLEQSLALALDNGFHEQAARVYTNVSEHAVVFKDYARAEHWLAEGIAFDRRHDLDAWTHYLVGWLAQLRLEQGRLAEAERIAGEVLATPRLTAVMRLPALTVQAKVHMRRGDPDAGDLLQHALELAWPTGEVQRIAPLVSALAEAAWLRGDMAGCVAALDRLRGLPGAGVNAWEAGEFATWRRRAGDATQVLPAHAAVPWRLELDGDPAAAAQAWLRLGAPNEAALALIHAVLRGPPDSTDAGLRQALDICQRIGASAAEAAVQRVAQQRGLSTVVGRPQRATTRARAAANALSAREGQVLDLLAQGMNNTQIAARLGVALRTAEHHVSAVLHKLSAGDRAEAVAIARARGLLTATG